MKFCKNIKVVAFDCDGVMFDTTKANSAYYNQILNHFDFPDMTCEQFSYAQMHTVDETMMMLIDDKKILEKVTVYRKSLSYIPFIKYMEIEPHLKYLLVKLMSKYKTAIATNRTDTMDNVLAEHDILQYFDLVVCASDVKHSKPHPDSLNKILDYFNIKPINMIYIGDSKLDEIAATKANVFFIAFNNKSLSAKFHVKSLKEIELILEM